MYRKAINKRLEIGANIWKIIVWERGHLEFWISGVSRTEIRENLKVCPCNEVYRTKICEKPKVCPCNMVYRTKICENLKVCPCNMVYRTKICENPKVCPCNEVYRTKICENPKVCPFPKLSGKAHRQNYIRWTWRHCKSSKIKIPLATQQKGKVSLIGIISLHTV